MENDELRARLEELHLSILQLSPAEPSIQKKRDALAASIRETLEQPDLGDFPVSLKDILTEESLSFEAAHPRVAQLMREAINLLNSSGM